MWAHLKRPNKRGNNGQMPIVKPEDILHLRETVEERLEAAEQVAVEHSQASITRFVNAYTISLIAMTHLMWEGESATTPLVESEWNSMHSWGTDRWRRFLADERETAAAALRDLRRSRD